MKIYIYLCLLLGSCNCLLGAEIKTYQGFLKSGTIMQINRKSSSILEQRHAIQCSGYGGQFMHNISLLSVSFVALRSVSKNQARLLLISGAEEHLKNINENQEIQEFLSQSPAQIKNVRIKVLFNKIDTLNPDCDQIS